LSASSTCAVFEGVLRSNPDQGEGDGDLHISLTPDGTRPNDNFDLLNSNNYKNGQPVMTAEVICWSTANKVIQINGASIAPELIQNHIYLLLLNLSRMPMYALPANGFKT